MGGGGRSEWVEDRESVVDYEVGSRWERVRVREKDDGMG